MKKIITIVLLFLSTFSFAQIYSSSWDVSLQNNNVQLIDWDIREVATIDDQLLHFVYQNDTINSIQANPTNLKDLVDIEFLNSAGYLTNEIQTLSFDNINSTLSLLGTNTVDLTDLKGTDDQNSDEVNILLSSANYSTAGNTLSNHITGIDDQLGSLLSGLLFKETWDAANNTPALTSGVGTVGDFYIVTNSGNTNLDGVTTWNLGDRVLFTNGGVWEKQQDNSSVQTVHGRLGAIVGQLGDYQDSQIETTYTPTNYTATNNDLASHLQGIDNSLETDMRGATVSLSNAATTQNLVGSISPQTVIWGTTEFNTLGATVSTTGATVPLTGIYEVCEDVSITKVSGTNNRQGIASRLYVNNAPRTGENVEYNRNASSINQFSLDRCVKLSLVSGDDVTMRTRREGSTANACQHSSVGASKFQITLIQQQ